MSDEALLSRYTKGQIGAFDCLYARHKRGVFNFLRRQCHNHAVAEELTHDTWLAVINQAGRYTAQAKFKTWLYRIANNRLVDYWRKYGSSAKVLFEELSDHPSEESLTQGIEIEELRASLKVLSPEQTEALLLKIEGFSHAEIADITNAKPETVKSRLRYATRHLRVAMEA